MYQLSNIAKKYNIVIIIRLTKQCENQCFLLIQVKHQVFQIFNTRILVWKMRKIMVLKIQKMDSHFAKTNVVSNVWENNGILKTSVCKKSSNFHRSIATFSRKTCPKNVHHQQHVQLFPNQKVVTNGSRHTPKFPNGTFLP